MSEHKITTMENYALLYFRIPYCAQKRIPMSNCQVSVIDAINTVVKSYVEANNSFLDFG